MYGLSLSDQYWICPESKFISWNSVNFFQNDFSKQVGDIMFGQTVTTGGCSDFCSPDNTSEGCLPKKWCIIDGKRYLIKGGSRPFYQEPLNEKIASLIMKKLNIPHVEYEVSLEKLKDQSDALEPFSKCECFITPETELITEDDFLKNKVQQKSEETSMYQFYIDCCNAENVPNAQLLVDQMIIIDFLIANEDRHVNNFGLIRNADTLEFISVAPIYDSGNSLWYSTLPHVMAFYKDQSKPFQNRHYKQIKFVSNLDWFNIAALDNVEEEIIKILKMSPYIDKERQDFICSNFKHRIKLIQKFIEMRKTDPQYDPEKDDEFNPQRERFDASEESSENLFDPFADIVKSRKQPEIVQQSSIFERVKRQSNNGEKITMLGKKFNKDPDAI